MEKEVSKLKDQTTSELLVELCKQINMRKYVKRQIMDVRIKALSLPKFRQTKLKMSSLLAPEEQLFNDEIRILRIHLHKTAERILHKNSLTAEDINAEEFELGSTNLIEGHCEFLSPDSSKTYLFNIATGEIVPFTTTEDVANAADVVKALKQLPGLQNYIQFMNLPPF